MSVTAKDIYSNACALDIGCELSIRTKISRAYYSAYHAANHFHNSLPSPGIQKRQGVGVHDALYSKLSNPTVADDELKVASRKIAYLGIDLKKNRKKADYELNETVTELEAEYSVGVAEKVMTATGNI